MSTPKPFGPMRPQAENRLMTYLMGWRAGAVSRAINAEQMNNEDFISGHNDGRKAVADAYKRAVKKYNAELSPLR